MSVTNYEQLAHHCGHDTEVVKYGTDPENPVNVSAECVDCYEVLFDYENTEDGYNDLIVHVGHDIEVTKRETSVCVTCQTCTEDLLEFEEGESLY